MKTTRFLLLVALLAAVSVAATRAQTPRINALFPAGGKAGETVEVAVRGGNLAGAKHVLITGADGVSAELVGANVKVDEAAKPVFQQKCTVCHEARSPANRSMGAEQWAATVDRMITVRQAPIKQDERDKIVGYLQALARAGQVTAKVTIAPGALPGPRELRVVTDGGASTAWPFEVTTLPEVMAAEPNSTLTEPQKVTLPVVVNGALAKPAERDCFAFMAKQGEKLTFNLKGFRLNEQSQTFFNPTLALYDAGGKVLAKSNGHFGFDPLIEWTAPGEGTYTLVVRDLLWHGSPASIYRLAMGALPVEETTAAVAPPGAGSAPDFALTATPDCINLAADGMGAIVVKATRRDNLKGAITVSVRNLPPGVSASPAVIPPDDDETVVTLTALGTGPSAQNGRPIWVEGEASGEGGGASAPPTITRRAQPLEVYRVNNNVRTQSRATMVIAIASTPAPFSITLAGGAENGTITLLPGGEARVTVRVTRQSGFKDEVRLSVLGLPPGVTTQNLVSVSPNQTEAIIALRASGDARFLSQRPLPNLPPMRVVIAAAAGDVSVCSAPLAVIGPPSQSAQK